MLAIELVLLLVDMNRACSATGGYKLKQAQVLSVSCIYRVLFYTTKTHSATPLRPSYYFTDLPFISKHSPRTFSYCPRALVSCAMPSFTMMYTLK